MSVIALAVMGLRQHTGWCRWALPVIAGIHLGLLRYSSFVLYEATSGGPPRVVGSVIAALALSAFVLSLVGWPRKE